MTRIGKYPRASITRYSVLCEGRDARDNGIVIAPVAYTSSREIAQDIAKELNSQLMENIYDISRVMEFFVEEEEISQNTEIDEEMLREFLDPNWREVQRSLHPPISDKDVVIPDPITELMKYIYNKEVPNESTDTQYSDSCRDSSDILRGGVPMRMETQETESRGEPSPNS